MLKENNVSGYVFFSYTSLFSDEELNKFSDEDLKSAYLFYLMNKGYMYDDKTIKTGEDVTEEEINEAVKTGNHGCPCKSST